MENKTSRREFMGTAGKLAALTAGAGLVQPIRGLAQNKKTRVALVGTGMRGTGMWGKDLLNEFGDKVEMVGMCDINPLRLEASKKIIGTNAPTFTDFDEMVKQTKPDAVIVTTVDATHDQFIIRAMELGCNVITEKPMTTDEKKCQAILDTEKRTGKNIIVTFNYRFSPHRQVMKEILMSGEIGELTSVDFHWYLDIHHGADYFRRWHRLRCKGGSLFVHKATHHFDLLNWWIDSDPETVHAFGELRKYGSNGEFRSEKCRTCPFKDKCDFYWNITDNDFFTKIYVECESADGYFRDGCVFRQDIDIWDTMTANVKYKNDVQVSYSLNAFMPYEGYRVAFNGTKGRLEHWNHERQPWIELPQDEIRLTKNFGNTEIITVKHGGGGHGGGDSRLKAMTFTPGMPDPWRQTAGSRDGAMAILPGIAARYSIDEDRSVKISDLINM